MERRLRDLKQEDEDNDSGTLIGVEEANSRKFSLMILEARLARQRQRSVDALRTAERRIKQDPRLAEHFK